MHITRLAVRNLRAINELDLRFEEGNGAGWHVILGDNGSGKSTVVRAVATVLMGAVNAHASRQDWSTWMREGEDEGKAEVVLKQHAGFDKWIGKGKQADDPRVRASLIVSRNRQSDSPNGAAPASIEFPSTRYVDRTLWGSGSGWFSASFGPFRRFRGGDPEIAPLYFSHPRLAAHLTALGEHVALGEPLRWLKELQVRELEHDRDAGRTKRAIVDFLNDAALLPHDTFMSDVTSSRIMMTDGDGANVAIEEMSDGYRSILSITLELLRLMFHNLGVESGLAAMQDGRVELPGIVAIDEVDAHLHPQWQRRIGEWFVDRFPSTQFLVTTHSPIICRAAAIRGSVWKLPSPGSDESPRRVEGVEYNRLVHGNILEALSTDLFGTDVTRSSRSDALMARLAELSQRQLHVTLDEAEERELQQLRETFPATPNGTG